MRGYGSCSRSIPPPGPPGTASNPMPVAVAGPSAEENPMPADRAPTIEFGWFMLGSAVPGNTGVPLLVDEEPGILPLVAEHFDSIWVPDHFYAFDDPAHAWIECWTALNWLAARYPRLQVGPIVLGVGYRNPALLAKMAATLQVL